MNLSGNEISTNHKYMKSIYNLFSFDRRLEFWVALKVFAHNKKENVISVKRYDQYLKVISE